MLSTCRFEIPPDAKFSVVVRAAKVIAALGADQLAVVTGEAVVAVGADLAMMVDGGRFRARCAGM
jgi:hypothetical protein